MFVKTENGVSSFSYDGHMFVFDEDGVAEITGPITEKMKADLAAHGIVECPPPAAAKAKAPAKKPEPKPEPVEEVKADQEPVNPAPEDEVVENAAQTEEKGESEKDEKARLIDEALRDFGVKIDKRQGLDAVRARLQTLHEEAKSGS